MKKMYTLFAVAAMMLCSVVANAQVAEFFNTYGILGSKDWNNTEILFPDEGVILVRDDKDRIIQLISTDNEMTPIQVTNYEYDTEKKVWKHVNHSVNTYERDVNDRLVKCTIVSGVEDPETYYQTFTYDVQTDKIVATITSYSSQTYLTFCKKKSAASINNIIASHASDRTYNILGQPTRANNRGICIRAGKKFIQR